MNPNLEYAQMIPGHNGGKGRCYGLLDTYSFVEMVSALPLLEKSKAFTPKNQKALYGFAQCYKYTGDKRYLDMSEKIADLMLGLPNMPSDKIPYWDMRMPEIMDATPEKVNKDVPRDASAASILASGLYLLSDFVEPSKAAVYRHYANESVANLTNHYRIPVG